MPARNGSPQPRRQAHLREANLGLALGQIAISEAPISRAGIATATGLTRATSSSLVDLLLAAGLVKESGASAQQGIGRPATGLQLNPEGPAGLGLEINVDYLRVGIVDFTGVVRTLEFVQGDFCDADPAEVVGRLAALATSAMRTHGSRPHAAVLAVPGLVRAPYGPLTLAPNLGWRDLDILPLLRSEPAFAGLELGVDNEANLAALAEVAETGERNAILVSGEIGIGGGVVLDGELFRGRHGWSGELGHLAVDPSGPLCRCGAKGCLEQYAGLGAILATAGAGPLADLRTLAEAGSVPVLAALDRAGWALGVAVSGALNLFDLNRVVLAGVFRDLTPWLRPALKAEIASRVLAAPWSQPTVVAAALGPEAAVLGAARSVVDSVLADPAPWVLSAARPV